MGSKNFPGSAFFRRPDGGAASLLFDKSLIFIDNQAKICYIKSLEKISLRQPAAGKDGK